jgi:hypothetical protein
MILRTSQNADLKFEIWKKIGNFKIARPEQN